MGIEKMTRIPKYKESQAFVEEPDSTELSFFWQNHKVCNFKKVVN